MGKLRFITLAAAIALAGCSSGDDTTIDATTTTSDSTTTTEAEEQLTETSGSGPDSTADQDDSTEALEGSLILLISSELEGATTDAVDTLTAEHPDLFIAVAVCSESTCADEFQERPIGDDLAATCQLGGVVWLRAGSPPVECELTSVDVVVDGQPLKLYVLPDPQDELLLEALAAAYAA